ncbi:hypothetical protein SLE2022_358560 [Rubroshorea leprosula]
MRCCCCCYCWCCYSLRDRILSWLRDYDRLQSLAVVLLYIQIACASIGSLGASYNGVLFINLAIALFALVAIENSSQSLGRTYAVLLFFSLFLDITWFILFSYEIGNIPSDFGVRFIFSVKLALAMQIVGFSVRLSSSFLWVQIYRLGTGYGNNNCARDADFDLRNSFLSPTTSSTARQSSGNDEALGGAIYDPAYYSSFSEEGQETKISFLDHHNDAVGNSGSSSGADASQLKSLAGRLQAIDQQNETKLLENV